MWDIWKDKLVSDGKALENHNHPKPNTVLPTRFFLTTVTNCIKIDSGGMRQEVLVFSVEN